MAQSVKNLILKIKGTITLKRIAIALVVAITIFLPTAFAIATVIQSQFDFDDSSKIHTVSLYDKNSRLLFVEDMNGEGMDESSLVDIFTGIRNNLEPINESEIKNSDIDPLTVELTSSLKTETLICYFSMSGSGAYCIDDSGKYYAIEDSSNELFLTSKFAEPLYSVASPPKLTTADGDEITVLDAIWSYKNMDGIILPAEKIQKATTSLTYIFSENISFSFASPPDSSSVTIFDGDEQIKCSLEDLDKLTLKNHSGIRVLVSASWNEHDDKDFYGTCTYDFNAEIHNRSEFFLSTDKLSVGEFAFIKITDVSEASKLSFKSDDPAFSLNFVTSGSEAYAVLPWSLLEGKERVDFTLNYGAASRSFTLTPRESFELTSNELKTDAAKAGVNISVINSHPLKYIFFTSGTYSPNSDVFEKVSCFGRIDGDSNDNIRFCDTYVCKDTYGASVGAIVGGKVIAVGNISGSKYVVLDSGLGVRTWYLDLSVSDVSVGDSISAGDVIGKTNMLDDISQDGFRFAVSFNDTFIDPDFILR